MDFVQLIASLYNRCNSETQRCRPCGGNHEFWLPIVEIDGVRCRTELIIQGDKSALWFTVESQDIFDDDCNNIQLYKKVYQLPSKSVPRGTGFMREAIKLENGIENEETFITFCNELKETIAKLKLDLHGKLVTDTKPDEELISFVECFKDVENVKLKAPDECCVCTNYTMTKTPCKHALCYRCWFKLDVKHNYDEDEHRIDCPLCRADIMIVDKH